jgi:hypothetical protein
MFKKYARILRLLPLVLLAVAWLAPVPAPAVAQETSTMTNSLGETVTLTLKSLPNSRGFQYCELVFNYGDAGSDIYSTSPLAPCDLDWWNGLDLNAVAAELSAQSVTKNGPEWWSMDTVAVMAGEPTTIAGKPMNFGAHLPPGTMSTPIYQVFNTAKTQNLTWNAGQPTYRLVDTDNNVYILQGYKVATDQLATLGSQFKELPEGWKYQVVNPPGTMQMNVTPSEPIPSVKDEFDQIYMMIQASTTTVSGATTPPLMPKTGAADEWPVLALAVGLVLLVLGALIQRRRGEGVNAA